MDIHASSEPGNQSSKLGDKMLRGILGGLAAAAAVALALAVSMAAWHQKNSPPASLPPALASDAPR
jgi:hypothetical protein